MNVLKVAILGVGSIGIFHAREFKDAGCEVVAILGSSLASAERKSEELRKAYGIQARPYGDIKQLLKRERIDIASVCTPSILHATHIRSCLEADAHVLCEKPLVMDTMHDNLPIAEKLYALSRQKRRVLSVNTQWPSVIDSFPKTISLNPITQFSMYMEPATKGAALVSEAIPHMNSMLLRLLSEGTPRNIRFPVVEEDHATIEFDYHGCQVSYEFRYKEQRPRTMHFSINGVTFTRRADQNYRQELVYGTNAFPIEDPLKVSVRMFLSALTDGIPLISEKEALENVQLQDSIMKEYHRRFSDRPR